MKVHYFSESISESEALVAEPFDTETNISPEKCWLNVRNTMEELALRTAVTYTDEGRPCLFYNTTVKGISCYEVGTRDNGLESVPVSGQEPRLLG